VTCCKGLLRQSQQAVPSDVAGIEGGRKQETVAVGGDSLLMLALCLSNVPLNREQAARGVAIPSVMRESQTLSTQSTCPNVIPLEPGKFCQTRQSPGARGQIACFARERQVLLQQSCRTRIVTSRQGECSQVPARAGRQCDVLV